ncbi:GlxA family transcriptional regulator [Methylobacterium pseudosasicola]|uniref:Transcriptional regulator, AraC family with amidase-like domain n=1 Tax=Methylobacterium pseudosasicola TaxID=582667 RepID=A0A1I4R7W8_9HYPH|nr:GlxA family transcriptional regulator [Methylobacterium pseudosasicola]SFM47993.1 transcriptional regulator, AraC family with amidase-like domain [Methylobacterium pseudosasicola]
MSQPHAPTSNKASSALGDRPQEIGYILVPGFALLSFASACEPFRAANQLAGRVLYRLRYFGEAEGRVVSSSGAEIPAEELPCGRGSLHTVFVCAGGEPNAWNRPAIHAALRRLARLGVRIGGISGGPYLMAAAGLLVDRAFTIHWEHAGATIEAFPQARLTRARYVADPDRLTCGGGVAPLDMAHTLIAERMGTAFARRVSDWFLHTAVSAADDPQRASTAERYGVHHPALLIVLETMEKTVEAPLGRQAMARLAAVSERHLDRLFLDKQGLSFSAQYRAIRLAHGRRLLRQSPLRIGEIATACGFSSAAHFSRSYRSHFGCSPSAER